MLRTSVLLIFLHLSSTYKVGLLLNTQSPDISASISNISDYFITSSSPLFTLETQHHDTSYPSILQAICNLFQQNVSMIISADDPTTTRTQLNIINQYGIPLINTVYSSPFLSPNLTPNLSPILIIPSDVHQSHAVFALLKEYNWTEFSILGSADDFGTARVMELQFLAAKNNNFKIRNVQYFDVSVGLKGDELVWFERELELIKKSLVKVIVLNCAGQFTHKIFSEAKLHGLLEDSYVWIVTHSAAVDIDLSSRTDSTSSQLYGGILGTLPSYGPGAVQLDVEIEKYTTSGGNRSDFNAVSIMVYKGLNVTNTALRELDKDGWGSEPNIKCNEPYIWLGGSQLQDKINEVLSNQGPVTFDIHNFWDSWKQVGLWQEEKGLTDDEGRKVRWTTRNDIRFIGGRFTPPKGMGNLLTGHHLKIATIPEAPMMILKQGCIHEVSSPKCWDGLNAKIIERLATDLNFTYEFHIPSDVEYGAYNATTRTWDGMVQLIVNSTVDMTTALIVNQIRSRFVTFTTSFFNDEASMVYYVTDSHKQTFDLFFFMKPFHSSVWLLLVGLVGVMAAVMTCLSKFSPLSSFGRRVRAMQKCTCTECQNRRAKRKEHKCSFRKTAQFECLLEKVEDGDLEDLLLKESAWIIGTGLVQHDGESQPQSPSGRFLIFTWWFFVMIITSIYTANLTAFLTLNQASNNLNTMLELLDQEKYEWGIIEERDLQWVMMNDHNPSYKELAEKAVLLKNLEEAVDRVQEGGFVLIAEDSMIQYNLNTNCKARVIETGKFRNTWAFAMHINSPYQTVLNERLLQYRTEGWLYHVSEQWYKNHQRSCAAHTLGANAEFSIPLLMGLFVILAGGVVVSIIWLVVEVLVTAHRDRGEEGFGATLRRWIWGATKEIACGGRSRKNACGGDIVRVGNGESEKVNNGV